MSGLNSLYISTVDLEEYFVSNQSALALANGTLSFFVDNNRTQAKKVFELVQGSGNPPNYTYIPLPNPITLSNSGTPLDANGNNVAIYYYPYDVYGNVELYYVECRDSQGNIQFTREAWPFPYAGTGGGGGDTGSAIGLTNMLTNPQFAQILFSQSVPLVINYSSTGTTSVNIAPGWTINISHTGSGSITVTQTPIAGISAYPYNPPFVLTIVSGSNVTGLTLTQKLSNNPDWAAPQIVGVGGYIAGSILLGSGTSVELQYTPSNGNATQTILNVTNTTGTFVQENATIELLPADSSQTGITGYTTITVNLLNTSGTSVIGNVQVIPLTTNLSGVQFDQTPVNRQYDQMFNYYNPLLQYKPISSYLVGWDFPLNPAQFLGASISAQATGAASSYYAWDQTILFQSANSAITVSRGVNGELVLTAAANTQMAIVQYLTGAQVNEILNSRLSVNVEAKTSKTSGYTATVSLWYSTGSALPSTIASNQSIVGGLNTTGYPVTFHQPTGGAWAPVPRSGLGNTTGAMGGGDAQFTIQKSTTTNFFEYGFSGWDLQGASTTGTATFFAIVLGTATITSGDSISINSISLVPGDIPTRPGRQSASAVLQDCQAYYEKSFNPSVIPAQGVGLGNGEDFVIQPAGAQTTRFLLYYKVTKQAVPTTITTYNPVSANAQAYDITDSADCSSTMTLYNFQNALTIQTFSPNLPSGQILAVNWTSDARLGQ